MPFYDRSMPGGFPGGLTRRLNAVTEPVTLAAALKPGAPLQLDATGKAIYATASDKIKGFLVRAYPTMGGNDATLEAYANGTTQDQLRSGYISVQLPEAETADAVKGTPLKLVTVAANGFVVGDLSLSEGTAIPGACCTGPADAAGVVEIEYNI